MEEGKNLVLRDTYRLLKRKDVVEIRSFLKKHDVNVNSCSILVCNRKETCCSVVAVALRCFHKPVMMCLLEEFGADLSLPCQLSRIPSKPYLAFAAYCGFFCHASPLDAVEYTLEHGGIPFGAEFGYTLSNTNGVWREALMLMEKAKTRCRTAWVLVWTLSQLTGTLWPDMSEPLAKMIVGIPLREFSRDSVKKKRV